MINNGFDSPGATPLERCAGQLIGVRPIFASAVITLTVVSTLAITLPALARNGSAGAAPVAASSSHVSTGASHSATPGSNATGSTAHRFSGTGSPPQSNNPSRREVWHHSSTPPGWTGYGEKSGWDGGRMPPGLSRHHGDHDNDHDYHHNQWSHHRSWGDERRNHERWQFHTGQLERRWGW